MRRGKIIGRSLWFSAAIATAAFFYLGTPPARYSQPRSSDHYAKGRFFVPWNENVPDLRKRPSFMSLLFSDERPPWPETAPDFFVLNTEVPDGKNFVQFINHASVLMDIEGVRLLADPIFSERASPVNFVGPKRHHATPFAIEAFKRIDFVLISHNHYDHMDLPTLKKLNELYHPRFIVPESNAGYLTEIGIPLEQITELDWWDSIHTHNISITLAPAQHWSRRRIWDRNFALWGSFMIEGAHKKIYFAGDTGYGPHFRQIYAHFGPIDMSLLPVGAYEPRGFMQPQHMNPEEAVIAAKELHTKESVGIHHSCFHLSFEKWDDPRIALQQLEESKSRGLASDRVQSKFIYPRAGEIVNF